MATEQFMTIQMQLIHQNIPFAEITHPKKLHAILAEKIQGIWYVWQVYPYTGDGHISLLVSDDMASGPFTQLFLLRSLAHQATFQFNKLASYIDFSNRETISSLTEKTILFKNSEISHYEYINWLSGSKGDFICVFWGFLSSL